MSNISAILLAGGKGTRMRRATPKQYLELGDKKICLYSFETLLESPEIDEIIVVCEEEFQSVFPKGNKPLKFAKPGKRRQDSVESGLLAISKDADLVCIHDSARPFLDADMLSRVIIDGQEMGAATAAMPLKFTVKQVDDRGFVTKTPPREFLYEVQTPQVIRASFLREGFTLANEKGLTVTDDTSLIELLGKPVRLTEGSSSNIKITSPEDLLLAREILQERRVLTS